MNENIGKHDRLLEVFLVRFVDPSSVVRSKRIFRDQRSKQFGTVFYSRPFVGLLSIMITLIPIKKIISKCDRF